MDRDLRAWLTTLAAELAGVQGDGWVAKLDACLEHAGGDLGLGGLSFWERRRSGKPRICAQWGQDALCAAVLEKRMPWLHAQLRDGDAILSFSSRDELPPEAGGDSCELAQAGIAALLAVPLRQGGSFAGWLVATQTQPVAAWSAALEADLALAAHLFGNTLGRLRAERAVRQAQARFTDLLRAAPDAIVVVRADGRIDYVNDRAEALFGYEPRELHGLPIEVLVPKALGDAHRIQRQTYTAQPAVRVMAADRSLRAVHKDGSPIPVEINLSPVLTDDGPLVTAIVRDVTERHRAEEKVREQRNELARVSRIATVGELAGALAHEINQPLAAILSNAQAAQRFLRRHRPDTEQVKQIVADIIDDDRRAAAVIHQMRRFLRREEVEFKSIELNRLIRDTVRALQSDLAINQVSVEADLSKDLPRVHGNLVQLQQVLLNLVLNAVDAMQSVAHEDRVIVVGTRRSSEQFVAISIRDNGHGVADEIATKIFGPFFTTKKDGMGLGLPITRSIIEAHGGLLEVANNPDRGCTFRFVLPTPEQEM